LQQVALQKSAVETPVETITGSLRSRLNNHAITIAQSAAFPVHHSVIGYESVSRCEQETPSSTLSTHA
jgi:hypothetical protein